MAAAAHDAVAEAELGKMYDFGFGTPRDPQAAAGWYLKSAVQGYAPAQHRLGNLYAHGLGVPLDYVSAYLWLSLAARSGHEDSKQDLSEVSQIMTPKQRANANLRLAEEDRFIRNTTTIFEMRGKAKGLVVKEKIAGDQKAAR
mgnify:CR=1 FL=1